MTNEIKQYVLFFLMLPSTFVSIREHSTGIELTSVSVFSELVDQLQKFHDADSNAPDGIAESEFLYDLQFIVGDRIAFIAQDNMLSPLCSCSGGHTAGELLAILNGAELLPILK